MRYAFDSANKIFSGSGSDLRKLESVGSCQGLNISISPCYWGDGFALLRVQERGATHWELNESTVTIHRWLAAVLRRIPQDGTFDQNGLIKIQARWSVYHMIADTDRHR